MAIREMTLFPFSHLFSTLIFKYTVELHYLAMVKIFVQIEESVLLFDLSLLRNIFNNIIFFPVFFLSFFILFLFVFPFTSGAEWKLFKNAQPTGCMVLVVYTFGAITARNDYSTTQGLGFPFRKGKGPNAKE